MFGLGVPEIIVLLVMISLPTVLVKMMSKPGTRDTLLSRSNRECLTCGYKGYMKTWLGNHSGPQIITLILCLFYLIPGIIFIAWGWGKYKCPKCGALGKNVEVDKTELAVEPTKVCPFCAETIKEAAVVCRFCNRELI